MEIDPLACASYIQQTAPKFAKAKADRMFIEGYLKTVKSQEMAKSDSSSLGQREADAYCSTAYVEQLKGLQAAVELEETYRYMMEAARIKGEIWKVNQYFLRQEMKQLG